MDDVGGGWTTIFVDDLEVEAGIGVYPHEHDRRQCLRLNIAIELAPPAEDSLDATLDYETIVATVHAIVNRGHIALLETMARLIGQDFLKDPRVLSAAVRIAKPGALALPAIAAVSWSNFRSGPARGSCRPGGR